MKSKILIFISGVALMYPNFANSACDKAQITTSESGGEVCSGVWCKNGCYVCCGTGANAPATACTGSYTTQQGNTFSDAKGSGYYETHVYTGYCICPSF